MGGCQPGVSDVSGAVKSVQFAVNDARDRLDGAADRQSDGESAALKLDQGTCPLYVHWSAWA
jgi:hypothetical protein